MAEVGRGGKVEGRVVGQGARVLESAPRLPSAGGLLMLPALPRSHACRRHITCVTRLWPSSRSETVEEAVAIVQHLHIVLGQGMGQNLSPG